MNSSSRRLRAMSSPIPEDTMADIFSRLPVKSLIRFKCISKSWFDNLTSNPTFIATHLIRSSQSPSLLIRCYHIPSAYYSGIWVTRTPYQTTSFNHEELDFPLSKSAVCFPRFVGSSNGLVCLDLSPCNASDFALWNPGMKELRRLPSPLIGSSKETPIWMVARGFGYDCFENDYKIVRIVYFNDKTRLVDQPPCVKTEVFTWSTSCWKEIEGFNIDSCIISGTRNAVAVMGTLNWVATELQDMNPKFIVSFDVNKEAMRRIALPNICRVGNVMVMSYKESLAFAIYFHTESFASQLHIWVMDESIGDGGNWVRVHCTESISRLVVPVGFWTWADFQLIMKQIKGDTTNLCTYDPRTENAINIPVEGTDCLLEPCTYVESLVSVHGR